MKCQDCIFWLRKQEKLIEAGHCDMWVDGDSDTRRKVVEYKDSAFGQCSNSNFINRMFPIDDVSANSLMYFADECCGADFVTGEDFGCVHFKGKNE